MLRKGPKGPRAGLILPRPANWVQMRAQVLCEACELQLWCGGGSGLALQHITPIISVGCEAESNKNVGSAWVLIWLDKMGPLEPILPKRPQTDATRGWIVCVRYVVFCVLSSSCSNLH